MSDDLKKKEQKIFEAGDTKLSWNSEDSENTSKKIAEGKEEQHPSAKTPQTDSNFNSKQTMIGMAAPNTDLQKSDDSKIRPMRPTETPKSVSNPPPPEDPRIAASETEQELKNFFQGTPVNTPTAATNDEFESPKPLTNSSVANFDFGDEHSAASPSTQKKIEQEENTTTISSDIAMNSPSENAPTESSTLDDTSQLDEEEQTLVSSGDNLLAQIEPVDDDSSIERQLDSSNSIDSEVDIDIAVEENENDKEEDRGEDKAEAISPKTGADTTKKTPIETEKETKHVATTADKTPTTDKKPAMGKGIGIALGAVAVVAIGFLVFRGDILQKFSSTSNNTSNFESSSRTVSPPEETAVPHEKTLAQTENETAEDKKNSLVAANTNTAEKAGLEIASAPTQHAEPELDPTAQERRAAANLAKKEAAAQKHAEKKAIAEKRKAERLAAKKEAARIRAEKRAAAKKADAQKEAQRLAAIAQRRAEKKEAAEKEAALKLAAEKEAALKRAQRKATVEKVAAERKATIANATVSDNTFRTSDDNVFVFVARFNEGTATFWFKDELLEKEFIQEVRAKAEGRTILVQGYVMPAEKEKKLGRIAISRAWAVQKYLQRKGIDSTRIKAKRGNLRENLPQKNTQLVTITFE